MREAWPAAGFEFLISKLNIGSRKAKIPSKSNNALRFQRTCQAVALRLKRKKVRQV